MIFPTMSAIVAALFGLFYVGLSMWVIGGRLTTQILQGDGGHPDLQRRMRSHANFSEYVPLTLLLIGLYEANGGSHGLVLALLILLLVARVIHPFGMFAAPNAPRQIVCRGGGILGTLLTLLIASVALLIRLV